MKTVLTVKVFCLCWTFLILSFAVTAADASDGPLIVTAPSDWKIEFHSEPDNVYLIDKDTDLLMLTPLTVDLKSEKIPGYLQQMAKKFVEASKGDPRFQTGAKPFIEGHIVGVSFPVNFVLFGAEDDNKQVFFAFNIEGEKTWRGTFTGTADGWNKAIEMLKSIRQQH